jgi:SCP-2 sterol transfer family
VPDEGLKTLMSSDGRPALLDEVFRRMTAHFCADQAGGVDPVVHGKILDRPDGGHDHHEIVIRNGMCVHHAPPRHDPTVTLSVAPVDVLRLITGNANGPLLFVSGRLQISGDLLLAARLPSLFVIPRA